MDVTEKIQSKIKNWWLWYLMLSRHTLALKRWSKIGKSIFMIALLN